MHGIARGNRVLLVVDQHLAAPSDKVIHLFLVLVVVVIRRDAALNHVAREIRQTEQARRLPVGRRFRFRRGSVWAQIILLW